MASSACEPTEPSRGPSKRRPPTGGCSRLVAARAREAPGGRAPPGGWRCGPRGIANVVLGAALLIAGCSSERTPSTQTASALKPIDQAALQGLVDTTIKEFLIPGAVVLLHAPQADFIAASGSTQVGVWNRPGADTHFRIASNTKTMTAAVILQRAQEGKLSLSDPVSKYVSDVPNGDNITIAQFVDLRAATAECLRVERHELPHAHRWSAGDPLYPIREPIVPTRRV